MVIVLFCSHTTMTLMHVLTIYYFRKYGATNALVLCSLLQAGELLKSAVATIVTFSLSAAFLVMLSIHTTSMYVVVYVHTMYYFLVVVHDHHYIVMG